MKQVICPAKINLFLEITGKREDSYHTLDMVMHTVSLADTLSAALKKGSGEIKICAENSPTFPVGEKNIAYRAAQKYFSVFGINNWDISMSFDKRIPVCAGLGGGSADAAGVLRFLEDEFNMGDEKTLDSIALSLGADVVFCLHGSCARATGIGEALTPIKALPDDLFIVIAKGENGVSTAKAYSDADALGKYDIKSADTLISLLEKGDKSYCKYMFNRFEDVIVKDLPEVEDIKNTLLSNGALGAMMSGSGSAVFGIFDSEKNASAARKILADRDVFSALARPLSYLDF